MKYFAGKKDAKNRSGSRPGGRFADEEGVIVKDWGGRLPVALVYPNTYHLGMSNLGVHAVYGLFNSNLRTVCERVFTDTLEKNAPAAIESNRPLTDFAVLAFSISYELDYFNVINILKTAGIPLLAAERDERYPLVIAGGPCVTSNPMPLARFFDAFCIGDAEPIIPPLLTVLSSDIRSQRATLLQSLAAIPGIYVPQIPPLQTVARQWAKDLNAFATKSVILTENTELGDSYLIEAERGCPRGCRFCLVNSAYAPMRVREANAILKQAWEGLNHRRRIGLVGPAVTDHPQINEILAGLNKMNAEIAVSSLRIDRLSDTIINELAKGKVQTITIAPEAGSQRLRDVVNKGITEDDIMSLADRLAAHHFTQLKMYFIIGLPGETDNDIEDIVKLTMAVKNRLEAKRNNMRIVVNASPFVPKASTPFQWLPMAPLEILNDRLATLKNSLPLKGIKLNEESPPWAQVQAALSRGDEGISPALAEMKEVSLAEWRRVAELYKLDIDHYVNRKWDTKDKLPWSVIDSGMGQEKLCGELAKAVGNAG
jgi:radical SAM superfamily enzyme YgiQ (UPF0313 family)